MRSATSGDPGTAYSTTPCCAGGGHEGVDDGPVDVVDRRRRLVHVVERRGPGHDRRRRVAAGAQEPDRDAGDGVGGGRCQQLGAGRAETDDHDGGGSGHGALDRALSLSVPLLTSPATPVAVNSALAA